MHNLAPQIRAEKGSFLSPVVRQFKKVFTATEDYWTWITVEGKEFYDVIPMKITAESVTFRHRYGIDSLELAQLSPQVGKHLQFSLATSKVHPSRPSLAEAQRLDATAVLPAEYLQRQI